jgi:predicted DCC family thiol-disulfide oxidoreductase YuxK
MVFGRDGGALPSLAMPVRLGLGALLGSGQQWVSWIHIEDLLRLVEFALEKPSLRGAVNAVAPNPATHLQLQHTLAHSLRRRVWMRVPAFFIRAALGEMAQLLVDGQRVLPRRALAAGFNFRHPDLRAALEKLVAKPSSKVRAELTEMYYNGDCPVCNLEMSHYARLCASTEKSLKFIDASRQQPEVLAACGLRRDHIEKRVYLKDSSGRLISGLPALVQLWWRMPRYRWLARVSSMPVLKSVFAVLYDVAVAPTLAYWARRRRPSIESSRIHTPPATPAE